MLQTEPSPYRQEAELPVEPDEVVVKRLRLAHLQRCEEVLDAIEDGAWVDVHERSRGRRHWSVEIYTGEYSDMYPVAAEGDGATLRAAVEDALGWDDVEPWYEPEPVRPPSRFFWWLVGVVVGLVAWWGF